MLAILDAYRAGLLAPKNWARNIIAGTIVGIVALPLAMAFAIASGVNPEEGLYTAIIAAVIVAVFGGSRVQVAGPTGAFVVILANITATYGVTGLQIATLLAGIMLILMGVIKLGNVIKYIPDPVIVGFTSGIAVIIFVGEWKDFFGLSTQYALNAHFHVKLISLIHALSKLDWTTTLLASLSLFIVLFTPKLFKRIPGPLIAMLIATALQAYFQFPTVATIGSTFGGIANKLPSLHIPDMSFTTILTLIGPAFTIAMLGSIESLLSAAVADGMARTRHYSNQELIGQGIANIVAPLFGGFAATGAIARTATNVRNGGNCAISAIVHSVFLIAVILLLAPYAVHIPLCALAAILFVVAYNMSDMPHFIRMFKRAPRSDVIVLVTTFLLTVFTDLVVAVNIGVILAMLLFIRQISQAVTIDQTNIELLRSELTDVKLPENTLVYSVQGPLFFGTAEKLEHVFAVTHTDPKNIILRLKHVPFIDMTGLQTLNEMIDHFHQRRVNVYLCEANGRVKRKLEKIGLQHKIANSKINSSFVETVRSLSS